MAIIAKDNRHFSQATGMVGWEAGLMGLYDHRDNWLLVDTYTLFSSIYASDVSCTALHSKVFTIGRVSPTCFCVFCFFQLVITHDHLPPRFGRWFELNWHPWHFSVLPGHPHASEVLAIDQDFGLFHRAWCVAELAEAKLLQMHQQVPWDSQVAGRTIDPKYLERVYTNIVYT